MKQRIGRGREGENAFSRYLKMCCECVFKGCSQWSAANPSAGDYALQCVLLSLSKVGAE